MPKLKPRRRELRQMSSQLTPQELADFARMNEEPDEADGFFPNPTKPKVNR
jgi:hypothetical protein